MAETRSILGGDPVALAGMVKESAVVTSIEAVGTPTPLSNDGSDPLLDLSHAETAGQENGVAQFMSGLELKATHLKSSPYADPVNYLDLRDLTTPYRLFAFALTYFQPIRTDYALAPYMDSFNWPAVFEVLRALCAQSGIKWERQEFYTVIFRSKLQANADRIKLGELDKKSHEEACASGGLLHYWFGSPDEDRQNLATCIWRNREDAAAGGKGPWHRRARGAAREMYDHISFHTHKLVVEDGAHEWRLEEYHD